MDDLLLLQSEIGNPKETETETEIVPEIGEIDRISELPEFIVHKILLRLLPWKASPVELLRMSVLSKKWSDLTSSFTALEFDTYKFKTKESFFKYVEYTTSRFCHHNIPAVGFRLVTSLVEPEEVDIVNRCLELVLKNGVNILNIIIRNDNSSQESLSESLSDSAYAMPSYRLPDVLLSVSILKSLTICGCDLPSSLMVDGVKFKSLTYLVLDEVRIDDEVIKYLTTSCPLLQVFHIRSCHGFKSFVVHGHQNLQEVVIYYKTEVERIDIEAPNLSSLWVADRYLRGAPPMNVASCKKLTTVTYFGHSLPNDFLSNFPFIKHLDITTSNESNILKWSSHSLRTLVLESTYDLDDIVLNTPNLVLFIYACKYCVPWPMIMGQRCPFSRDLTDSKACMHCFPYNSISTLWFEKLRRFLDKKNGLKVLNLYIQANYSQNYTELEDLKAIEMPPYELEHVELQLDTHAKSSAHIAFVGAVLWCCRPRSLTLRSLISLTDSEDQYTVVMFTNKKLLEQEDQGQIKLNYVGPFSSEAQKQLMDSKSLSIALRRDRYAVCFIKEKVVQEEAG